MRTEGANSKIIVFIDFFQAQKIDKYITAHRNNIRGAIQSLNWLTLKTCKNCFAIDLATYIISTPVFDQKYFTAPVFFTNAMLGRFVHFLFVGQVYSCTHTHPIDHLTYPQPANDPGSC